ncbi:MAG: hypothetical protein P1V97_39425 [Planctomycetota bacterium]|nr:hypothetical protein [Planctomycetota bacterium]
MQDDRSPKLSMQLSAGGFERFLQDGGGVDFRLNEECWRPLNDGDVFEFVEDPGESRRYCVRIIKKYTATSFSELIDCLPAELFDHSQKQDYLDFFREWWSSEEEAREGVLGLHIEVLE